MLRLLLTGNITVPIIDLEQYSNFKLLSSIVFLSDDIRKQSSSILYKKFIAGMRSEIYIKANFITQMVGTLRSNQKGIPKKLKEAKLQREKSVFLRRKHLLIQTWKDKREIYMISMRHNSSYETVKNKFGV